jgi:uncharacterized membrane protein YkvA (DUF1232 family)
MITTMPAWWSIVAAVLGALATIWLVLAVALWLSKPARFSVAEMARLLPDVLRLITRIATDSAMPVRIRVVLFLLLAFIASPIDLIPDIIPVIGYADDVILIALALRWITRTAGNEMIEKKWPGTPEGLNALRYACRLVESDP